MTQIVMWIGISYNRDPDGKIRDGNPRPYPWPRLRFPPTGMPAKDDGRRTSPMTVAAGTHRPWAYPYTREQLFPTRYELQIIKL